MKTEEEEVGDRQGAQRNHWAVLTTHGSSVLETKGPHQRLSQLKHTPTPQAPPSLQIKATTDPSLKALPLNGLNLSKAFANMKRKQKSNHRSTDCV